MSSQTAAGSAGRGCYAGDPASGKYDHAGRDLTQLVNDFTWYLRNLLLLKSSDNMEDVLDVSAENLEQLKEEAAMGAG